METPQESFDETTRDFVDRISKMDIASEDATTAIKNLETFVKCRPACPEETPTEEPVPDTVPGKIFYWTRRFWRNETTRVLVKSGGALAGTALVVGATVKRDHIIERQALDQSNRPPQ